MKKKYLPIVLLLVAVVTIAYFMLSGETASTPDSEEGGAVKRSNNTNSEKSSTAFDKRRYSNDDAASIWVVSNKQRPLQPKTYVPEDLVKPAIATRGTQYLREPAAKAAEEMFSAAKTAGITLRVESAYRSYTTQVSVYNNEVKSYGQAVADTQSARPGYSEHQTGLAADFGAASGKCSIADCFAEMDEGKWLAANAQKYGFIMRYVPGKQQVTGYRYEAWHFRYVGKELADEMKKQNIVTLEEFFGLPAAPNYN